MNITIISPLDIAHPYILKPVIINNMPARKGQIPPNKNTGQTGFLRRNIEEVKRLYYEEKLCQREVAEKLGVHQSQVSKIMQEFKLKPRDCVEMQMLRWKNGVYDALRKRVAFTCDCCGQEADMPLSQWKKSKKHYCSKRCRLTVLKQARGEASMIGRQKEEKWLKQQMDQHLIFRCVELPDFMKITPDGLEFYEIKSRRWHLRPRQKSVNNRLQQLGFNVKVVIMA